MRYGYMVGILAILMFAMGMTAQAETATSVSFGPDAGILASAGLDKSCRVVAKQKLFDGIYKVYYVKPLPDGGTQLESADLLQTSDSVWVMQQPRELKDNQI